MEAIKDSIAQLSLVMYNKLDNFESEYRKNTSAAVASTSGLSSEFGSFKNFVVAALRSLQDQIEMLDKGFDNLEMRGRRKMLLFHGLEENTSEDPAAVVAKVVVDRLKTSGFVKNDIARCHRLGRPSASDKPRPILVKFCNMGQRSQVWSSKTSLKGTGVTISEFLTRPRHETFIAARERFGVSKCWTRDGNVYILDAEGSRHRVCSMKELDKIAQPSGTTQASVEAVVKKVTSPKPLSKPRRAAASGKK